MKILDNIALLASDTTRTKAYLQVMAKHGLLPAFCIVYSDEIENMENATTDIGDDFLQCDYFDRDIPLLALVKTLHIPYMKVKNSDINSEDVVEAIKGVSQQYIIYSGYGGGLLKPPLFHLGKRYLHVHAGILPAYRGSTTAYYSILDRGCMGATAFFLNEGIDEGDMISQSEYEMPKEKVDIDYVYEPYTRALELVNALNKYDDKVGFRTLEQDGKKSNTYFIIHPVLKHLALKKVEKQMSHVG